MIFLPIQLIIPFILDTIIMVICSFLCRTMIAPSHEKES